MIGRMAGAFRRVCALLLSVFMILSQFAMPVSALAQDLMALPMITLHYVEGETTQSVTVFPGLYGTDAVYWAMVPQTALQSGLTLEIAPSVDEAVTYHSRNGYELYAWDASAVDGNALTWIEISRDGLLEAAYPLYVSTMPMPQPEVVPQPATITVNYVDSQTSAVLNSHSDVYYAGDHAFTPNAGMLPENYVLVNENTVYVTVFEDGTATQSEVVFFATYSEPVVEPQPATITVNYVDSQTSALLNSHSDVYYAGDHAFTPNAGMLPENYVLVNENTVYVTVFEDGTATQSEVVFFATYNEPVVEPQPATITVNYVDSQTSALLNSHSDVYFAGDHAFTPDAGMLPENYVLDSENTVYVTVFEDGTATQYEVVFFATYSEPVVEPQPATITVNYVDSQTSAVLNSHSDVYYAGDHAFTPNAGMLPENYVLDSENTVYVTVFEDGTATQSEVVFFATYSEPVVEPQPATITVNYVDSQTSALLNSYSDVYFAGDHAFTPDAGMLPENYVLDSENTVYVTVFEDGTATQYEVVFFATYNEPVVEPQPATITVSYVDSQTSALLNSYSDVYFAGDHAFTPNAGMLPENYVLDNENTVYVTVFEDGTATQYEVVFFATYSEPQPDQPEQPAEPVEAIVMVYYVGADGYPVTEESHTFTEGVYTISAHAPEGYTLNEGQQTEWSIEVDAYGNVNYPTILFNVTKIEEPAAPEQPEGPEQPEEPEQPEAPEQPTEPEQPETPSEPTLPEGATLIEVLNIQGKTTTQGLNIRKGPSTSYDKAGKIPVTGTVIDVHMSLNNSEGNLWYQITHEGVTGYVSGMYVELIAAEPASADVTIRYTADGAEIPGWSAYTTTLQEGTHPVSGLIAAIDGYTFVSASAETIVIDANGANPAEVVLTYQRNPVSADVTIHHVDQDGNPVVQSQTISLAEGSYNASGYQMAMDGYTFGSASAETIVIDANGANPAEVILTYQRNPVSADVTIHHVDQDGNPVAQSQTISLAEGSYNASGYQMAMDGYTFVSASAESIVIDANGANPAEVVLTYQRNPVTANVVLQFADEQGNPIAENVSIELGEASHPMIERQLSIPGYTFQYVIPETVNVGANGADAQLVTFTYKRDPVTAEIIFHYVDEAGNPIADAAANPMGEGSYAMADYHKAIEGYTFQHASPASLVIGAQGADASEITFVYSKDEVKAQVTFLYADDQGNAIPGLENRVELLGEGTWNVSDYAYDAPQGYLYSGASAQQITVTRDGVTPAEVLFTYTRLPDNVTLPVYYLDADRQPLMETKIVTFTAQDFGKTFNASDYRLDAPGGYEYAGVSSETVTVDERGGITPQALEFTYTLKPAAKASVTFEYLSTDGKKVADIFVTELPEGVHDTGEYAAKPEKYNLKEVSSPSVTITADGKADPAVVTFTYEPVKDKAILKVHYRSAIGEDFAGSPEIRELPVGTHTITPNASFAPAGYALSASTQSYTVTVRSDLVASPASVSFTYYDASVTADVTVRYQDSVNGTVIAEEVRKLTPGTHDLQPDESIVSAKGNYVRSGYNTNSRIVVDESGKADYSTVLFYYQPAEIENYIGYLLVTQQTSLREQPGETSASKAVLPVDTVILTNGQQKVGATEWYSSVVQTGNAAGQLGWVIRDHVRRISSEEAAARMEEKENKEPEQNPGLYITLMDGVPLRRYMSTASEAKYLKINVVVTVSGQEYDQDGYLWHKTRYNGVDGYVRDGQLRKLTTDEVNDYLSGGGDTSTGTPDQYNPNGASSYGYITSDGVNFRSEPGGTRIKMLNKYAMALITGSRVVNGVRWYNVNYSGQVGWVHGDFFHQMSLTEFTSFVGSTEYYQGITNNTTVSTPVTQKPSSGSTGSATQGNVSSVEDWNVGAWQNPNAGVQSTWQPFNPYATPAATAVPNGTYTTDADTKFYQSANTNSGAVTLPKDTEITITGTVMLSSTKWYAVTYDGKTGYIRADDLGSVSATPTPAPTATFAIGTMIPINYEDESKETQTSSVPWGLIAGAVVLVGGAGGVYAYALNQNKRRKAAARAAAARRARAAASGNSASSPYARRAVAAPTPQSPSPYSGAQQVRNPYSSGSITGSAGTMNGSAAGSAGSTNGSAATTNSADPYMRPSNSSSGASAYSAQSNPYASGASVNPYAASSSNPYDSPSASASSNPYARPIGTVAPSAQETASADGEPAVRRRATRMQRYHAAENGNDANE